MWKIVLYVYTCMCVYLFGLQAFAWDTQLSREFSYGVRDVQNAETVPLLLVISSEQWDDTKFTCSIQGL